MNYIDITQSTQTLKLNLNQDDNSLGDADFFIYKDGSDSLVVDASSEIDYRGYYHEIEFDASLLSSLEDEKQYTITILNPDSNKVIYRGKFQTTSKDLNNLSVNEGQYIKKTTATNYTILD